jgi:DNA-binding Lrp family transcriptional regulator
MANYVADRTDDDVLRIISEIQEEYRRVVPISASQIAQRAGCTVRTVQNAVKRLEDKGRLKLSNEKGKPTRYQILD